MAPKIFSFASKKAKAKELERRGSTESRLGSTTDTADMSSNASVSSGSGSSSDHSRPSSRRAHDTGFPASIDQVTTTRRFIEAENRPSVDSDFLSNEDARQRRLQARALASKPRRQGQQPIPKTSAGGSKSNV